MSDFMERLEAYHVAMCIVRSMLIKGIISADDYKRIEGVMAEKYGLSTHSIFR